MVAQNTPASLVVHRAPGDAELTDRGLAALDLLADVLVHRMARTPEGIVRTLAEVMHAPVADLREALACVDQHLQKRAARRSG